MHVICAIAKNENKYMNDWLDYHFNLGFDHIYIFDNNNSSAPKLIDAISPENQAKITIFNVNDIHREKFQIECYNTFYNENKNSFDWCAFIDIDEFICLKDFSNIKDFLQQSIFKNTSVVRLGWHVISDNELITRDTSIPIYKALKTISWNPKLTQGKTIIRGGLKDIKIVSCHYANQNNTALRSLD